VNLRRIEPKSTQRLTMAFRAEAREAERKHEFDLNSAADGGGEDSFEAASLSHLSESNDPFDSVVQHFDDPSPEVRSAAALALSELAPARPADLFTRALENASAERKRRIGEAIAASGLAAVAIDNLDAVSREETYNALCLLFVMAKAGEVQPLVHAIESHADAEVRSAAIKLLNLSGQAELAHAAPKETAHQN
jgi:HEAT repeat protein